jgi:hypothetical protein
MIPIRDLFESHLTVSSLKRLMSFFGEVLGFEIAQVFLDRKVGFYLDRWSRRVHAGIMGSDSSPPSILIVCKLGQTAEP